MPPSTPPPLSSTVSLVFEEFLKQLKADNLASGAAQAALAGCLREQKFDHESLRIALLSVDKAAE
jgi:hypothetical protein